MIYLPIFGKDSEPHSSSRLLGLCSTMILWTAFFCVMLLIGSKKEPQVKYETVQIQLAPQDHYVPNIPEEFLSGQQSAGEVVQEAIPETSLPNETVPEPVPVKPSSGAKTQNVPVKTVPEKVSSQSATTKNNQTVPATSSESSASNSTSSVPFQNYSESIEDQMNAQLNGKKKAAVWDESLFADTSNAASSSSSSNNKVVTQDASYSGSAATSSNANQSQTSSSTSTQGNQNTTVSDSTSQALSSLMNSQSSSTTDRGTQTSTSIKSTKTGDGKTQIQMSDGSSRTLIEPSTIAINFSAAASATITENHEVQIRFSINENGYVVGTISISQEALFAQIVRDEIRAQISKWRFESAANTSVAVFTLKMIKK